MKHVRAIVTEVGAQVDIERVIISESSEQVELLAREAMREVIKSDLEQAYWPEDFETALDRGYWWTDFPSEQYSVLILTPLEVRHADLPVVQVHIEGGAVTSVQAPLAIKVRVVDYDVQHTDPQRIVSDAEGRPCVITNWGKDAS
ncbi:MAG: hypothetical protein ACE37H_04965 [Phycisphaeraceae bacterium]